MVCILIKTNTIKHVSFFRITIVTMRVFIDVLSIGIYAPSPLNRVREVGGYWEGSNSEQVELK